MEDADFMVSCTTMAFSPPDRTPVPASPPQPFRHDVGPERVLYPYAATTAPTGEGSSEGWEPGLEARARSGADLRVSIASSVEFLAAHDPPRSVPTPCPPGPPEDSPPPSSCDTEAQTPSNAPYGEGVPAAVADVAELRGTLAEVDRVHGLLRSSMGRLAGAGTEKPAEATRRSAAAGACVVRNAVAPGLTLRPAGGRAPMQAFRPFEDVSSEGTKRHSTESCYGRLSAGSETWLCPRKSSGSEEEVVMPLVVDASLQRKLDVVTAERDALRDAALASSAELRKAQQALASAVKALAPPGAHGRSQSSTRTRGRGSRSPDAAPRRSASASAPQAVEQRPHPHPRMKHLMQYGEQFLQREPIVIGTNPTWTHAAVVGRRSRAPTLPKRTSVSQSQTRQNGTSTLGVVRSVSPPARIPAEDDAPQRKALGAMDPNRLARGADAKVKKPAVGKAARPGRGAAAVMVETTWNTNESLVVHPTVTRQVKTYPKPTISSKNKRDKRPKAAPPAAKATQRSNSGLHVHPGNSHRKLVF